jgi:hypothetical protein
MKYPLTFLLSLRKTRMERCEQALAQARALVKRRHEELEDRIREHREYVQWCDNEEDRLFAELFSKPAQHQKVLDVREEMLANRSKEAEYLKRIDDAQAALEAARAEEVKCLEALQIAIRNREKLDSHKLLWTDGFKQAEQMAEDLVMEETAESAYLRNMQMAES